MAANSFDIVQRRQVFLERLKAGEAKKFEVFLREMDKVLRDRLTSADITSYERTRVERLLADVSVKLEAILGEWRRDYTASLIGIAETDAQWEARALNEMTTGAFEAVVPALEQVRQAITLTPMNVKGVDGGQLLAPFLEGWSQRNIDGLTGVIRQGYYQGRTTAQILGDLRGSKALNYADGTLALTNRSAQGVIKTTIQDATTKAREETLRANSRVVTGVVWTSTLDDRTTEVCRSLDGRRYELNEGPRPPAHFNCRSTVVPEIDKAFSALEKGMERASIDGPVPAKETYYEWLKNQPAKFQDEALGPTRAALFRDGGISAQRFSELNLGRNFEPLTLLEMQRLEPVAFDRAGIKISETTGRVVSQ